MNEAPSSLSPAQQNALGKAWSQLCFIWNLGIDEQQALLGQKPTTVFSPDASLRALRLVACYNFLHSICGHNDAQTALWLGTPNTDATFAPHTPLLHMMAGGIDAINSCHHYLEQHARPQYGSAPVFPAPKP